MNPNTTTPTSSTVQAHPSSPPPAPLYVPLSSSYSRLRPQPFSSRRICPAVHFRRLPNLRSQIPDHRKCTHAGRNRTRHHRVPHNRIPDRRPQNHLIRSLTRQDRMVTRDIFKKNRQPRYVPRSGPPASPLDTGLRLWHRNRHTFHKGSDRPRVPLLQSPATKKTIQHTEKILARSRQKTRSNTHRLEVFAKPSSPPYSKLSYRYAHPSPAPSAR